MEDQRDVLNVAVVNFKPATGNKKNNLRRMVDFSIAAAKRGADLVLFPELCLTGYDYFVNGDVSRDEKLSMAETLRGTACADIAEVTKKYGIYVVFDMGEKLNVQEGVFIATIDLSLARRRLMDDTGAGEPDYRPELYRKFI